MNSAMWRTLRDEIPLEATPHELDAALRDAEDDDLTENQYSGTSTSPAVTASISSDSGFSSRRTASASARAMRGTHQKKTVL